MKMREPRHYLSYVREELIADWKLKAVVISEKAKSKKGVRFLKDTEKAKRKLKALSGTCKKVWPWAYQLGRTPTARSLRKHDVLWIVARIEGMDMDWPPALVARMELCEDAQCGPKEDKTSNMLSFPFHYGVSVFSLPDKGDFFPANDATRVLLDTKYKTELKNKPQLANGRQTLKAHSEAWRKASQTGFQSLRKIKNPILLENFAKQLKTRNVFVSYNWDDHLEEGEKHRCIRNLVEELIVRRQIGVWLDTLTLPPSKHTAEELRGKVVSRQLLTPQQRLEKKNRREVIKRLLSTPLREAPLLVAHITKFYGRSSKDKPRRRGFTLIEWNTAGHVLAWIHDNSCYKNRLKKRTKPVYCLPSKKHSITDVAGEIERILNNVADQRRKEGRCLHHSRT